MRDGFRWSPDGSAIAYWQFDRPASASSRSINDTDALYPASRRSRIRRPAPPTPRSASASSSADGGATTWMKTPGDPRDRLPRAHGVDRRETVAIQQLNRLQNRNDFLLGRRRDAATSRACSATSRRRWVDVVDDVHVDRRRPALPVAQRARRLAARLPRAARRRRARTLDHAVRRRRHRRRRASTSAAAGSTSWRRRRTPTQRYLYRSKLDGTGTPSA